MVFRTRPAIRSRKKGMPMSIGIKRRQLRMIQPTFRMTATPTMHEPSTMNSTTFRIRPVIRMKKRLRRKCTNQALSSLNLDFLSGHSGRFGSVLVELSDFHVPDKSELLEQENSEIVLIEFVPGETVAGRNRMRMVIVVPSFAAVEQCDPPAVARVVFGINPARTPHVCGRIHQPG